MRKKHILKASVLAAILAASFVGTIPAGSVLCQAAEGSVKHTVHGNIMVDLSDYLGGSFSNLSYKVSGLEKIKDVPGEVKYQNYDITATGTSSENIVRIHYLSDPEDADYDHVQNVPAGFGIYIGLGESDARYELYSNGWTEIQPTRDMEWQIFKKGKYYVAFYCKYCNVDDLYIALDGYLPLC